MPANFFYGRVFAVLKMFEWRQSQISNHRSEGACVARGRMTDHLVESWNNIIPDIIKKMSGLSDDETWSVSETEWDCDFQPTICLHGMADLESKSFRLFGFNIP
jgi:hypothetical protein